MYAPHTSAGAFSPAPSQAAERGPWDFQCAPAQHKMDFGIPVGATELSDASYERLTAFAMTPGFGHLVDRMGMVEVHLASKSKKLHDLFCDRLSRIKLELQSTQVPHQRKEQLLQELMQHLRTGGKSADVLEREYERLLQTASESVAEYKHRALALANRQVVRPSGRGFDQLLLDRFIRGLLPHLHREVVIKFGVGDNKISANSVHDVADFLIRLQEISPAAPMSSSASGSAAPGPMVAAIGGNNRREYGSLSCVRCFGVGHSAKVCPAKDFQPPADRDQPFIMRMLTGDLAPKKCYRCQAMGHVVRFCPAPRPVANHSAFVVDALPPVTEAEWLGMDESDGDWLHPNVDSQGM